MDDIKNINHSSELFKIWSQLYIAWAYFVLSMLMIMEDQEESCWTMQN